MTTYVWQNPSSGNWESWFDWSPFNGSFPHSGDTAEVLGSGSTSLNVTHTDQTTNLFVENPNARINVNGAPANLYTYGEYYQNAGRVNLLNEGYLFLEGTSYLAGGAINSGAGCLLLNYGTVYEEGTRVNMSSGGGIFNASGAYWDILNDQGVTQTGASQIVNDGVWEKTGGSGKSNIAGAFVNNANVYVGTGDMHFLYNCSGGGNYELFNHASTVEFNRAVNGDVDFTSWGQHLFTHDLYDFNAIVENFQAGDTFKITGPWHETNYFYNGTNTILDLTRNGFTEGVTFAGYVPGLQVHTGLANTTITHS